jgi:hypothetical protein
MVFETACLWLDNSLSALIPKLKEQQVQMIVDRLSHFTDASNQNAELRDISSTGTPLQDVVLTKALRTVILEIPSNTQLSHILISQLLPRLLSQVYFFSYNADVVQRKKCCEYNFP